MVEALRVLGWDVDDDGERLAFEQPVGTFGYSGEAFQVLLHAVCRARAVDANALLAGALTDLAMRQSSFVWRDGYDERAAIPHTKDGDDMQKARPQIAGAFGTLHTTVTEYAAFAVATLRAGSDDVFTPQVVVDDGHGRSLGWATLATEHGTVAWQHGDNLGFKHLVAIRRDRGDGVVVFTNRDDGQATCRTVARDVLGVSPW